MAMVDTLEFMSEEIFNEYRGLQILLKEAIHGIAKYPDKNSSMWYQVVDRVGERKLLRNFRNFNGCLYNDERS